MKKTKLLLNKNIKRILTILLLIMLFSALFFTSQHLSNVAQIKDYSTLFWIEPEGSVESFQENPRAFYSYEAENHKQKHLFTLAQGSNSYFIQNLSSPQTFTFATTTDNVFFEIYSLSPSGQKTFITSFKQEDVFALLAINDETIYYATHPQFQDNPPFTYTIFKKQKDTVFSVVSYKSSRWVKPVFNQKGAFIYSLVFENGQCASYLFNQKGESQEIGLDFYPFWWNDTTIAYLKDNQIIKYHLETKQEEAVLNSGGSPLLVYTFLYQGSHIQVSQNKNYLVFSNSLEEKILDVLPSASLKKHITLLSLADGSTIPLGEFPGNISPSMALY